MFLPLHDGVPMRNLRAPFVTYAIILVTVAIYIAVSLDLLPLHPEVVVAGLGMIPAQIFGVVVLPEGLPLVPVPLTPFSSILVHATLLHLIGNMLFLWVFGDNVEDAMGHVRFLFFYLACGATAALVYALTAADSIRPLVGASGAVSGVIGAYLVLHPRVKIWGLFLNRVPLKLRAFWGIGFWICFQLTAALVASDDSTAWTAHLGGLVTGFALVLLLHRRDQPLFGRGDDPKLTGDA